MARQRRRTMSLDGPPAWANPWLEWAASVGEP